MQMLCMRSVVQLLSKTALSYLDTFTLKHMAYVPFFIPRLAHDLFV
jgi:hypothetical protein